MKGNRAVAQVSILLALVLALIWSPLQPTGVAAPEIQSTFPYGAVVRLQGTPHLFIADSAGILRWGGDTRALRSQFVEWSTTIDVSLDTLKTLTRGDPYLSAGLVQDGEPIYLVKWETEEAVPRLLHIQCIADVELFGIKTANYLTFVHQRSAWEMQTWEGQRLQVSSLQKAELPGGACQSAGPTLTATPTRPRITGISSNELIACISALGRYGLGVADVSIDRTVTVALPPSVLQRAGSVSGVLPVPSSTGVTPLGQADAVLAQSAPLTRASSQTSSELLSNTSGSAIGVIKLPRGVSPPGAGSAISGTFSSELPPNIYVVVVRGGTPPRLVFTSCGQNSVDNVMAAAPDMRQIGSRNVVPPQAIVIGSAFCFSWNRVQVCTPPSPRDTMTANERNAMDQVMNESVGALAAAGRLQSSDINTAAALPDLEGLEAVNRRQASMLAAPATAPWDPTASSSLVGAFHVDLEILIPNTQIRVPPGDYAVRVRRSGTSRTAELISVTNTRYEVPVSNVEVLGNSTQPYVAIVSLVLGSREEGLCFWWEC